MIYQWQRNGTSLPGATSSSYSISSVTQNENQSVFGVQIANAAGIVFSQSVTLSVLALPDNTLKYLTGDLTPAFRGSSLLPVQVSTLENYDGRGEESAFVGMSGLAADRQGNVFVAHHYSVRKIRPDGLVSTLAGQLNNGIPGYLDGNLSEARFGGISDIEIDSSDTIYLADVVNSAIRKISREGLVSTVAGGPSKQGYLDGVVSQAKFSSPRAVAAASTGDLYVVDVAPKLPNTSPFDHPYFLIRKISTAGMVTTVPGGVLDATARNVTDIAVDKQGNIYVSTAPASFPVVVTGTPAGIAVAYILKITPSGAVSTFAGTTQLNGLGALDGQGITARFNNPSKLAIDGNDVLYVADSGNRAIRRISPQGFVTTVVGILPTGGAAPNAITYGTLPAEVIDTDALAVSFDGSIYLNSRVATGFPPLTPSNLVALSLLGECRVILKAEPR